MSNNIEEDIKTIHEYIHDWHDNLTDEDGYTIDTIDEYSEEFIQAIENILADREKLQSKANKYDSLIEKIKGKLEEIKVPILIYGGRGNGRTYAKAEKEAKKYILQYLLNILEEGEKE